MPTTVDLFVPLDEAGAVTERLPALAENALGWGAGSVRSAFSLMRYSRPLSVSTASARTTRLSSYSKY